MQSVDKKWYIAYRWAAAGVAAIFLVLSVMSWTLPALKEFGHHYGLNYATGVLSFLTVVYGFFLYDRVAEKRSHIEAMLAQAFIQALAIVNITQATGGLNTVYVVGWICMALLGGMFGFYATGGVAFLAAFYYILDTSRPHGNSAYSVSGLTALASIILASFISHFIWRSKFADQESAKVANLAGKLKANEQQSELLVQALTDGVLLLNTDGQITLMNPAAALMTGWSVEEGTSTDFRLVLALHKEDGSDLIETENPITRVFATKTPSTETLQLVSRQGKQMIISLVSSAIVNPKTNELLGAIAVMRDISVAHQEEKQRAEFISTASHEMRTPVAAIEGYLALAMNDKVSKIDPKARGFLEKAHESTQHLGKLFQDLLMSAKAEDGRLVSHPEVVELGAFVEDLADSFRFSAEKKGLLTDFVFGTTATSGSRVGEHIVRPLYNVHVDPDRLREVITNLFDNAVKYTPSGKVSVGLTGNDEVVQVYVRDTGPGIPAEDLPHLFQKFYRVDNSATRTIGGTGLGLFICRKIIELYKGRIWVESTLGEGSTFYINLPRLSAQKTTELQAQKAQGDAAQPVNSLTTPV